MTWPPTGYPHSTSTVTDQDDQQTKHPNLHNTTNQSLDDIVEQVDLLNLQEPLYVAPGFGSSSTNVPVTLQPDTPRNVLNFVDLVTVPSPVPRFLYFNSTVAGFTSDSTANINWEWMILNDYPNNASGGLRIPVTADSQNTLSLAGRIELTTVATPGTKRLVLQATSPGNPTLTFSGTKADGYWVSFLYWYKDT